MKKYAEVRQRTDRRLMKIESNVQMFITLKARYPP